MFPSKQINKDTLTVPLKLSSYGKFHCTPSVTTLAKVLLNSFAAALIIKSSDVQRK